MSTATWHLVLCGISHKTADLEKREPLQLDDEAVADANSALAEDPSVHEVLVVATCNRIEFYIVMERTGDAWELIADFYRSHHRVDISPLKEQFYVRKGSHAAAHLFRVAGGMDSMVLGENQVLAQIRAAYSSACAVKSCGKLIHRLFHQAFRVGKQVRTDTPMGQGACSVSSAAIDLLKSKVSEDERPTVLFVGINQMIKLAASNLSRRHHGDFLFANRTAAKAEAFAESYRGEGFGLEQLPDLLSRSDVLITCTGATEPVVGRELIDRWLDTHPNRTLIVVDMAIPRDVAVDGDYHPRVEVNDLEQIRRFVEQQQHQREEALPQAEEIVRGRLDEFVYWYNHAIYEPTFYGLAESFERMRKEELAAIVGSLSFEQQEAVEKATRRLVERLLHAKVRDAERP